MRRRMWKTDLHEDDVHDRFVIAGVATFNIQATSSCVLSTSLDIHTPPINILALLFSHSLVFEYQILKCLVALRKIGLLSTKSTITAQFNRCRLMSLLCHVLWRKLTDLEDSKKTLNVGIKEVVNNLSRTITSVEKPNKLLVHRRTWPTIPFFYQSLPRLHTWRATNGLPTYTSLKK